MFAQTYFLGHASYSEDLILIHCLCPSLSIDWESYFFFQPDINPNFFLLPNSHSLLPWNFSDFLSSCWSLFTRSLRVVKILTHNLEHKNILYGMVYYPISLKMHYHFLYYQGKENTANLTMAYHQLYNASAFKRCEKMSILGLIKYNNSLFFHINRVVFLVWFKTLWIASK